MLVCVLTKVNTKVNRLLINVEERQRELGNEGRHYDGVCCQEVVLWRVKASSNDSITNGSPYLISAPRPLLTRCYSVHIDFKSIIHR